MRNLEDYCKHKSRKKSIVARDVINDFLIDMSTNSSDLKNIDDKLEWKILNWLEKKSKEGKKGLS